MKAMLKFLWAMISGGSYRSIGLYLVVLLCGYISILDYQSSESTAGLWFVGIFIVIFWIFNTVMYLKEKIKYNREVKEIQKKL